MAKTRKSEIITVRMSPAEKESATNLADQLGLNVSDVIRLAVIEIVKKGNISIQGLANTKQEVNNG